MTSEIVGSESKCRAISRVPSFAQKAADVCRVDLTNTYFTHISFSCPVDNLPYVQKCLLSSNMLQLTELYRVESLGTKGL